MARAARHGAATALLALLSPLCFLAVIEGLAWLLRVQPLASRDDYQQHAFIRSCRWNPVWLERVCDRPVEAPEGRVRVYVFGGSSVVGYHVGPKQTLTYFMQNRLDDLTSDTFSVHNLGSACKDTIFVEQCVRRAVHPPPDLIVLYTGHNDFSGFSGPFPRLLMWVERRGWWLVGIEERLARTRFFALLTRGAAAPFMPDDRIATRMPPERLQSVVETILEHYVANLEAIVALAAERSTPVVLVTLASNLHEFPVPQAEWDQVLEQRRTAAEPHPWLLHYAAGIESFRSGRFHDALDAFRQARDADFQTRAPGVANEALRELAGRHAHVHLVDFEVLLHRVGLQEGIGCSFFGDSARKGPLPCDGVHPNPSTNRLIGHAVAERIAPLWEVRPAPGGAAPAQHHSR